jgi:hypothetical protein
MNTVTAAPVSPLARLRAKLAPLPPATAKDRARWKRIAEDRSPVVVTEDAPEVGPGIPGIVECAPPASFVIDERTAAWFDAHGGAKTVLRALRSFMRTHAVSPTRRTRRATAPATTTRR